MKFKLLITFFLLISLMAFSQQTEKEKQIKTGWNFGLLPAVSYNTDLGFQYGGLVNFFNYGDGSSYPDYLHNIYLEISRYTKGSAIYRLAYDSEYLIKGIRITSDLAYLPDEAFDFYGFNGYQSFFNSSWQTDSDAAYKSRMFYKYKIRHFVSKPIFKFRLETNVFLCSLGSIFNRTKYQQ